MNHVFRFSLNDPDVVRLLRHSRENIIHQVDDAGNPCDHPHLCIVKDSGAYLCSPFVVKNAPADARLHNPSDPSRLHVAYADGCTPEDEWIGGDDFVDTFAVPEIRPGDREMIIRISETQIRINIAY